MKYFIPTRAGFFGISAEGAVFRMYRDASNNVFRNHAGSPINWAWQSGLLAVGRANVADASMRVVPVNDPPTQGVRLVILSQDGQNTPSLLVHNVAPANIRRIDQRPVQMLPGQEIEIAVASRSAETYIRSLDVEFAGLKGGGAT